MMNTLKELFRFDLSTMNGVLKLVILALIFVILFIIVLAVIFLVLRRKTNNYLRTDQNTRVYIINFKENIVRRFDKQNIRNINEVSIFRFLEQFEGDGANVERWLQGLLKDDSDAKVFLETQIRLSKNNKNEFVLLELTHLNKESSIIHLESHLLPHLSTSSRHNGRHYFINFETLQAKFNVLKKLDKKAGVGILIRLFSNQEVAPKNTMTLLGGITIQVTNILTKFLSDTRYLCVISNNEIFILDVSINNRSKFFALANDLVAKIKSFLVMGSLDDEYDVALGGVQFDQSVPDIKVFISRCREMTNYVEQNGDLGSVALYEETSNKISNPGSVLYKELSNLIHNRAFRYYFTPIIKTSDASVLAYNLSIIPYGISLKTFAEVIDGAQDVNLITSINQIVMKDSLKSVRNTEKIILPLSLFMLNDIINHITDCQEKPFILAINQNALDQFESDSTELTSILNRAKNLGFELALYFDNVPVSPLSDNFLIRFDYFILSGEISQDIKANDRSRADLRLMIATYSPYGKPVIVYNLSSMDDFEIALANGVEYFICSAISSPSSALEKIDEKKSAKVITLSKRLH